MILIPYRTDRPLKRTPWVNYSLIVINVVIFMITKDQINALSTNRLGLYDQIIQQFPVYGYYLEPTHTKLHQFITYAFLHAGAMHLMGNMLFLFVFGNSVEDRLGRVGYLGLYLCGAVMSGLGHVMMETAPAIGASGAVSAVTGAYLALMARTYMTVFYFFFVMGTFEVSSLFVILFQIISDVLFYLLGIGQTAYIAHLSGYALGFSTAFALVLMRLLPREPYDLLAVFEHRRRRAQFSAMTRDGYQPWDHTTPGAPPLPEPGKPVEMTDQQRRVIELRTNIGGAIGQGDLDRAAELYCELIEIDPGQTLSVNQQNDVGNVLMKKEQFDHAARTYELLLNTFPNCPNREEVSLILGLIYTRYVDRRQRARELLKDALPKLHDDDKALAEKLLKEIDGA